MQRQLRMTGLGHRPRSHLLAGLRVTRGISHRRSRFHSRAAGIRLSFGNPFRVQLSRMSPAASFVANTCRTVAVLCLVAHLVSDNPGCLAQDEVIDDEDTWNAFFRDMRSTPQFPHPGTLNLYDWDQYMHGFPPSIWDTKDFASIIPMKSEFSNYTRGGQILWEYFWRYFEVYMQSELHILYKNVNVSLVNGSYVSVSTFQWKNVKMLQIWDGYIQVMRELYCCEDKFSTLGQFGFGCNDRAEAQYTLCCKRGRWMQRCDNYGLQVVKTWSADSIQVMKFKFYVWLCTVHIAKLNFSDANVTEHTMDIERVCPNPCRKQPCDELPNAIANSCSRPTGPERYYQGQFICECRTNYQFDVYSRQCLLKPLCSMNPCSPTGLLRCVDLIEGYRCDCKPEFTGSICKALRDPCITRLRSDEPSGNMACKTNLGNRCTRDPSADAFLCDCVAPYTRETSADKLASLFGAGKLPPDNCQATHDACSSVSCNTTGHGRCMPAGDHLHFICVCDKDSDGYPLFEGKFCDNKVSQWLPWSPWTRCRPECGESCFQARQRPCRHRDGQVYCLGSDEELRPCEPACQPCPNRSFAHLSGVFVKETAGPLLMALASLFLVQVAFLAAVEWAVSRDALAL